MPRILFDSTEVAKKVAQTLRLDWDGCNSVAGLYTEEAGFEETVERLKSEWCVEGQCCELSSAHSNPSLGESIIMLDESYLLWDRLLEAETESLNLRWKRRILRRDILKIEGVPNAEYQADDSGRVFVFQSLLDRVEEKRSSEPDTPIAELVAQSLPDAWMSAQKAVVDFEIVPRPYSLIEIDGKLTILHEPFNAVLPPRFDTESKRHQALAKLLLGERLPGVGEFVFRGQAMTRLDPPDLTSLLIMPELGELPIPEREIHPRLEDIRYHPEMPLLTEKQFDELKKIELAWATGKVAIKERVYAQAEELWQLLSKAIDLLPQVEDAILDYEEDRDNARALRSLYPELQQLSDSALYVLYDNYEDDIYQARSWEPDRSDGFLCYLFGCLVDPEEDDTTRDIGEFVGYSLLIGKELTEAITFARSCWDFDLAMSKLCWYLRQCQCHWYLEELPVGSVTRLTGERVGTFRSWVQSAGGKAHGTGQVGQLLEQVDSSPGWVGDDFDECLEDVNRNRS